MLEGHSKKVTGLCWSSHFEGLLVTVAYDRTAVVCMLSFFLFCACAIISCLINLRRIENFIHNAENFYLTVLIA